MSSFFYYCTIFLRIFPSLQLCKSDISFSPMLLISIIKYLSSFDNPRCHSSLENIAMRVDKGLRFEIIKYGFYLQFDISCTYYTSQKRSLQVYKQHCISRFAHFLSLCYLLWFSSISITERYFSFRLSLILRAFSCFSDYYTS